jgi:hypothetical protein
MLSWLGVLAQPARASSRAALARVFLYTIVVMALPSSGLTPA